MQPQLGVYDPLEEETQRRIAAARAAGWDEQTIQRNAMIDRALRAQQRQPVAPSEDEGQKVSGLKRFLVNSGAMAGSIGAGILGAAFAVPTFGGSVAGAAGAGMGIEALRRKLLGEDQSLKASLVEGGLAALPGVFKGAKALTGLAKGAAPIATAAAKAKPTVSMRAIAQKASSSSTPATSIMSKAQAQKAGLGTQYTAYQQTVKDWQAAAKARGGTILPAEQKSLEGLAKEAGLTRTIKVPRPAPRVAATQPVAAAEPTIEKSSALRDAFRTSKEGPVTSRLLSGGQNLKAQARGVIPGAKPQGAAERLLPSEANKINETLNSIKAKGAVPRQLRTVEAAQQKALTQIDDELARADRPLAQAARNNMAKSFTSEVTGKQTPGLLGMTDAHRKLANEVASKIRSTPTLKGQEELRRVIDKRINFARNPASPDPIAEEIYKVARRNIDNAISAAAPGLKAAKTQYAGLEAAKDALIVNTPATLRQAGGRGIVGTLMSGSAAQKGLDVAGNTLVRAGKISGSPIVRVGVGQQIGRSLFKPEDQQNDPLSLQPAQQQFDQAPENESQLLQQLIAGGVTDGNQLLEALNATGGGGAQTSSSNGLGGGAMAGLGRSSSQLLADSLATYQAGNPEGAKYLMSLASQQAQLEQSQGGTAKLDATTKKATAAAQNALSVVDQIEEAYNQVGGAQGAIVGTARNLGGKIRADQNANFYNSQKLGFLSRIARAFGEVGTLAEGDVTRAANLMPDLADTPENAARKLAALRQLISEARDRALMGSGATFGETPSDQGIDLTQLGL